MRKFVELLLLMLVLTHTARGQSRRRKGQRDDNQVLQNEGKILICPVEIMFILDSSEKAKVLLFEKQKDFVLRFSTRLMQIQAAGWRLRLRLAALQYSSSVSLEHNFRDWQDVDVFQSRVASMAYIGHGTYSAYAITNATQMFSRETAANSLRVMLLMTDGVDHPRSPSAVTAAAEAKNHNIRLFTIGLSGLPWDGPTNARLRSIASAPPQQHVLSLTDNLLEDKLFRELCPQPKSCLCDKGERGPPGSPGKSGQPGSDGTPGPKGFNGQPGTRGGKGERGECGTPGMKGDHGLIGGPGDQGSEGPVGPKGDRGPGGVMGPPGDTGIGFPGPKGFREHKGPQERVYQGLRGYEGPKGIRGTQGSGFKGDKGDNGPSGSSGPRGPPGLGIVGP
ncbi:unnamed protein product, partial [Coregonus sp. 'balchen']